jgi:hypothetical protein
LQQGHCGFCTPREEANILKVSGIQFDTVRKVTQIENGLWFALQKQRAKFSPFLEFWKMHNQDFKYPTDKDVTTVFSMFTCGKSDAVMETLEDRRTMFQKWFAWLQAAFVEPEGFADRKHDTDIYQVEKNGAQWAKEA